MANRRTPDLPQTPEVIPTKKRVRPRTLSRSGPLKSTTPPGGVTADTRSAMIAEAAYLRAEQRGFAHGYEVEDWLLAEREVDALLSAVQGKAAQ